MRMLAAMPLSGLRAAVATSATYQQVLMSNELMDMHCKRFKHLEKHK